MQMGIARQRMLGRSNEMSSSGFRTIEVAAVPDYVGNHGCDKGAQPPNGRRFFTEHLDGSNGWLCYFITHDRSISLPAELSGCIAGEYKDNLWRGPHPEFAPPSEECLESVRRRISDIQALLAGYPIEWEIYCSVRELAPLVGLPSKPTGFEEACRLVLDGSRRHVFLDDGGFSVEFNAEDLKKFPAGYVPAMAYGRLWPYEKRVKPEGAVESPIFASTGDRYVIARPVSLKS